MDHQLASQFVVPQYSQLLTNYDMEKRTVWYYLNPRPRPCFTTQLLEEIVDFQSRVKHYRAQSPETADSIRYLVLASATPAVFGLGGDLDLFASLISNKDSEGLRRYAYLCIDCIHSNATRLQQSGLTTISLVQGKALGGGFEAALSSNVVIAERGAQLGFPEIVFNLFPGMGAYNLLTRRVSPIQAERFLRSGDQYDAEALHGMGVVDVLAEKGEGMHKVYDYIRRHERARNGLEAIQRLREWNNPITREELERVADLWVDTAMQISAHDLRTMMRLTAAQFRLAETSPVASADRPKERAVSNVVRVELPAVANL